MMNRSRESLAVIIPTKDRPDDLRRLLMSIYSQEVRPVQVLVVDGGLSPAQGVLEGFTGLRLSYARVVPPSLTVQRNAGIRSLGAEATLVAFLDDDIILERDSIKNMLSFWEGASGDTGGAAFNITNMPYTRPSLAEKIFLVNADRPNRILPSGFQSKASFHDATSRVDWVSGCAMVWRKDIFSDFLFDEWFSGYARYEEVDFCYRVGRRFKIFVVADARAKHMIRLEDPGFSFSLGKMEVANRLYFVRKNRGLSMALCIWALLGFWLNNIIHGAAKADIRYLRRAKGNARGFVDFLLGRGRVS